MSVNRAIAAFLAALALGAILVGAAPARASFDPESGLSEQEYWARFDEHIAAAKSSMLSDPAAALSHAQDAEHIVTSLSDTDKKSVAVATALWLQSEALTRVNEPAGAPPLIDRALAAIDGREDAGKLRADLLLSRGRAAMVTDDFVLALQSFQDAHRIFSEIGEARSQAIALQNIGSIYNNARAHDRALEYYQRADAAYSDDAALKISSFNNQARIYQALGDYDRALENFNRALALGEEMGSPLLQARILSNIASLHVQRGELRAADNAAARGLALLGEDDATGWSRFLYGVKAGIELERGDLQAAQKFIVRMFGESDGNGNHLQAYKTPPYRDFHETAYKIWRRSGRLDEALHHHEIFKELDDLGRDVAASANTALMGAEFDFASQQLEIEQLRVGQLQRDFELAEARARQRTTILFGFSVIGALITLFVVIGYISVRRNRNQIRAANRKLMEANERLSKTNEALEAANRAKTDFLATTSHEIRTPLNGVLGMADALLRDGQLNKEDRDRVETVKVAGDALLAVVNDVLDVAKIESGKLEIEKLQTNLREVAEEVRRVWSQSAREKGVEFSVAFDGCPESVMTDGMRLRQILFNLASNAVKFTTRGSVRISFGTDGAGAKQQLRVDVADTGIGIPESEFENIFDTFSQVDRGAARQFGGTGLGLAICQKLARAMGGEVRVSSKLGEGSVFTLLLPLEEPVYAPSDHRNNAATEEQRSCPKELSDIDLLIVEDNPINRKVIEQLLAGVVRSIDLAEDGVEGVDAVQTKHYDVVFMDKQMPNMDGVTATKTIRSLSGPNKDVYIVAVTADAFEGERERLIAQGMDDYVAKPVTQEMLIRVLADGIERGLRHRAPERRAMAS
ncbi:MAG: hypothetical protein Tsb0010_01180 [Parvularculaceae bacterium]